MLKTLRLTVLLGALLAGSPMLATGAHAYSVITDVNLICLAGCSGEFAGSFSFDTEDIIMVSTPTPGGFAPLSAFSFDIMGISFDQTDTVLFAGASFDTSNNLTQFSIEVYDVVSGVSINLLGANSQIWQAGGTSLPNMTGVTQFAVRDTGTAPIPEPHAALVFAIGLGLVGLEKQRRR